MFSLTKQSLHSEKSPGRNSGEIYTPRRVQVFFFRDSEVSDAL